ncbi:MAG TPA: hypothetical protein VHZ56_13270, partial [Devosia sp.]|nr:hypothetical protein [Devosia sp.]
MRRTRVALIVNFVWLAAAVVAGLALWLGGGRWPGYVAALIVLAAAFAIGLGLAAAIERRVQRKLAALGRAVGAVG